jgi:hypothetical protein
MRDPREETIAVLTYRCPGCGKQHVMDKPFDEPFVTRCLRCGETFAVTEESIHEVGQFTAKQPQKPGRSQEETASRGRKTAMPPPEDEALDASTASARTELDIDTPNEEEPAESLLEDDDPLALADGTDLEPVSDEDERPPRPIPFRKSRGKKGRRPKGPPRKGSGTAGSIWDDEGAKGEEADDEAAPPPPRPKYNPYTPEAPAQAPPWWKRWQVLAGAAGGLLLVVGLGVYLFYPRGTTTKQDASTTKPPAKSTKPSTVASGA